MQGIRSKIVGTGMYVPGRVVTNAELSEKMDTSDEWIQQRTGIIERRWIEEGESPASLAETASRQALEDAGLEIGDIDCILLSTLSPEHEFPGTSFFLHERLGASEIPCIDLREADNHHHPMWLNSPGNAGVMYYREDGSGAAGRDWTCTCSDCNGLVGVWSCPGFYGTTITVTEDCKCNHSVLVFFPSLKEAAAQTLTISLPPARTTSSTCASRRRRRTATSARWTA